MKMTAKLDSRGFSLKSTSIQSDTYSVTLTIDSDNNTLLLIDD